MSVERTMISFNVGATRFNYRTAAIAIRDGHVLVCREDDDDYVMLPGGRVEMGEASDVALAREVAEELHSTAVIQRLVFTAENFFEHNGVHIHEIGTYYLIDLPVDFPFRAGGVVRETQDEGLTLRFQWVPIDGGALSEIRLQPRWMIERLRALPAAPAHLVLNEQHL